MAGQSERKRLISLGKKCWEGDPDAATRKTPGLLRRISCAACMMRSRP
ncbi:hypothetical protein OAU04_06370 [Alphaproteobacteria bacterium]|nr:hypothetical protein [Alphaproteobacteria bacterium]